MIFRSAGRRSRERDPKKRLKEFVQRVDDRLPRLLPSPQERPEKVHEAMLYAATGPGKRLRPALCLAVAEIFGEADDRVLDLACSVEMVHACSLILDDLPMMDDASLRRGRVTTHLVYGEDVAVLASYGLLNQAYAIVAERALHLKLDRYTPEDLVHLLTEAVGSRGLVGGQALDLESAEMPIESLDLERLEFIHSHKTGALFTAAAELGAMAVDARRAYLSGITRFAKNLGLAFQIADDLLDVSATVEETGKDGGQDEDKLTFVKLLGVEGAEALLAELLQFAVESVAGLGKRADTLRLLAEVVRRKGRI